MSGARVERAQGVNDKLHSRCPRCSARVGGAGDVTDVVVAGPACRSGAHVLMRVRALAGRGGEALQGSGCGRAHAVCVYSDYFSCRCHVW